MPKRKKARKATPKKARKARGKAKARKPARKAARKAARGKAPKAKARKPARRAPAKAAPAVKPVVAPIARAWDEPEDSTDLETPPEPTGGSGGFGSWGGSS